LNKTYHDFLEAAYFGRYRRWVEKMTVNGGAPEQNSGCGHPIAALPNAPQYRVVK